MKHETLFDLYTLITSLLFTLSPGLIMMLSVIHFWKMFFPIAYNAPLIGFTGFLIGMLFLTFLFGALLFGMVLGAMIWVCVWISTSKRLFGYDRHEIQHLSEKWVSFSSGITFPLVDYRYARWVNQVIEYNYPNR